MNCNGKCYLVKQLKEQQKQEQSPASKKDSPEVNLFLTTQEYNYDVVHINSKKCYYTLNDLKTVSFPRAIFHPPSV